MYPEYEAKILIFDSVNFFKISPLSVTPKWNEVPNRPLNQVQRKNLNGVILPDGTIFFVGGWSKGLTWDSGVPVYEPEIYDPFDATQPWQQGAPMKGNRGYHSTAILMYDGRVLVGGGEPRGDNSHHFEIYTPDCLLRGPRPAFSLYANIVAYGQRITIKLGGDWKYKHLHPERIALVRCASVTHAFSFDQRYVNVQPRRKTRRYIKNKAGDFELPLDPVSRIAKLVDEPLPAPEADDTEFEIEIPSHSNLLPPGYYFLFLMSKLDDGSPGCASLAQIIQIT